MDTLYDGSTVRRRRRTHSAEFKAKVVSACRRPGISMAAVALAHGLNANLVRRWVVTEERTPQATPIETAEVSTASTVEQGTFIPVALERSPVTTPQSITIELRRGAMVAKVDWPLAAATECSGLVT